MNRTQHIEYIRGKCVEANPDIKPTIVSVGCPNCHGHEGAKITLTKDRTIRLADILLAIGNMMVIVDCAGNFYQLKMKLRDKLPVLDPDKGSTRWALTEDDLNLQSDETLLFIYNLLQ